MNLQKIHSSLCQAEHTHITILCFQQKLTGPLLVKITIHAAAHSGNRFDWSNGMLPLTMDPLPNFLHFVLKTPS